MNLFLLIGHVTLQFFRPCNIIAMLLCAVGSWVLIIGIDTSRRFWFFEALTLCVTSFAAVAIIFSELPFVPFIRNWFRRFWPVLSEEHSHIWVGIGMFIMGSKILGSYDTPAHDHASLGKHFSRVVIGSGILTICMGGINILCGIFFRIPSLGINSRTIRDKGALSANGKDSRPGSSQTWSSDQQAMLEAFANKESGQGAHLTSRSIRPIRARFEAQRDVEAEAGATEEVVAESRSPIAPGITRPDPARHPIHHRVDYDAASVYSVADLPRT